MFEQFKENLSLAREFRGTARDGLRSAQTAWRKATPEMRGVWLVLPTVLVVLAVAEHYSAPWYYGVGVVLLVAVIVNLGSGIRRAMLRKLP